MEKQKELEKIKIEDYRCLILDQEGTWYKYPKEVGIMHQDCIEDFAKEKNMTTTRVDDIAKSGNFIFLIVNKEMLAAKTPDVINEKQSIKLDFFSLSMKNIKYLEIEKIGQNNEVNSYCYMNEIEENFANDFLQSYYKKEKGKSK